MSGGTRNPRDTVEVPDPSGVVATAKKAANAVTDTLIPAAKEAMADAKEALANLDPQKKEERCVFFLKWGEIAVSRFIATCAVIAWILKALGYNVDNGLLDRAIALAAEPAFPCPPVECICEASPADGPPVGE